MTFPFLDVDVSDICYPCELLKREHKRRKAVALHAALNSPLVLDALEELAISVQISAVSVPAGELYGYLSISAETIQGISEYKGGDRAMGAARLTHALATALQDTISKRVGVIVPVSGLTHLAGTFIGVYMTEYIMA